MAVLIVSSLFSLEEECNAPPCTAALIAKNHELQSDMKKVTSVFEKLQSYIKLLALPSRLTLNMRTRCETLVHPAARDMLFVSVVFACRGSCCREAIRYACFTNVCLRCAAGCRSTEQHLSCLHPAGCLPSQSS